MLLQGLELGDAVACKPWKTPKRYYFRITSRADGVIELPPSAANLLRYLPLLRRSSRFYRSHCRPDIKWTGYWTRRFDWWMIATSKL